MTRNVYLLLLSCLLLIHAEGFGQGKSKNKGNNGNGNGNGPKEEKSVFPPYGNTGIGTRYPSEKLEVIGNAKISQTVFANELNVVGIQATSFTIAEDATIGRNLLVSGNLGIGVAAPSEKLDIAGNIRVSSTLFADQVTTTGLTSATGIFSGRLTAGENVLISGLTGMGVSDPAERLEVAGNIKVSDNLLANGFQVNQGSVTGDLSVTQNTTIDGQLGVGVSTPAEKMEVAGNIKSTQNIIAIGLQVETGMLSQSLTVGENLVVDGNIGVGVNAPTEKLDIAGNIKASGSLIANYLAAAGMTTDSLRVSETMRIQGVALFDTKVGIGVSAPTEALDVAGNIRTLGSLTANAVTSETLNTATATVSNDLTISGTTTANALEATEFTVTNQVAGTIKTNQLAINTETIPTGFAMAVDGKVIASQIEVFAPENWPDYVFESGYNLRSLAEVDAYIQKHGHLPNVLSAERMQQGGYDLSQMDAKLLEKIEELTLYMIELKKENDTLKEQIQQLSK